MIAVIADDFTGAAEIGGLGLRYGLSVKIETEVVDNGDIDLMIIATDTRSMNPSEAASEVTDIAEKLIKINPEFIFKKTDSVMRGNILSELSALMNATGESSLVLVSANPLLGRTIVNNNYFINEVPLHQTGFANDPEFPTKTSNVTELLGYYKNIKTCVGNVNEEFLSEGIIIAESKDDCELKNWTAKLKNKFLYAGAAGHFISILEQIGLNASPPNNSIIDLNNKICVYVCGSAIDSSRIAVELTKKKGSYVCEMPDELIYNKGDSDKYMAKWLKQIKSIIKSKSKVIIAINKPLIRGIDIYNRLRKYTADVVYEIFQNEQVDELIVEGGATAYSIIQRCAFKEFYPTMELAHGVLRMKVHRKNDFSLTLKPGSYLWPKEIWNF